MTADIDAIRAVIGRIEAAFNAKDAALAVEDFTADAWAITATGRRIRGRRALLDAHREGFAGFLADEQVAYEVADVTFPRTDVAVVEKLAWATDAAGARTTDEPAMVALYVMVERRGRWWIQARANVPIASGGGDRSRR